MQHEIEAVVSCVTDCCHLVAQPECQQLLRGREITYFNMGDRVGYLDQLEYLERFLSHVMCHVMSRVACRMSCHM